MDVMQGWPAADRAAPANGATPEEAGPSEAATPPRPWLAPVVAGAIAAIASVAWWAQILVSSGCYGTSPAVGFGFLVLMAFGGMATAGVGIVFGSRQASRRRIGRALLLAAIAAAPLFLLLTSFLPIVLPACQS
jgi:hypothetical protein